MKFVLISDMHGTSKTPDSRKDDVLKTFSMKITYVLDYARRHKASLLQAGDFCDKPRDWYFLSHLMDILEEYKDIPIYTIFGQHDSYLRSNLKTPTTLSVLNKAGLIKILGKTPIKTGNVRLYGASWGRVIPKPQPNDKVNILVVHAPVHSRPLFPKHEFKDLIKFAEENKGYKLILVGDIHRQFFHMTKKTHIINTGPMLRLDATKYNKTHRPTSFIYDTKHDTVGKFTIPHKDYDQVLDYSHIIRKEKVKLMLNKFIKFAEEIKEKSNGDQNTQSKIRTRLLEYIKKNKISRRAEKIITKTIEEEEAIKDG